MFNRHKILNQSGSLMILNIIVIFIFSLVMMGVLSYATIQIRLARSTVSREQAFQVAEAGINYYQWHLAHYPTDFWDGNASTTPGPYEHAFTDKDSNQILGRFSLAITPPPAGSSVVTIISKGWMLGNPQAIRTITARYGIASLAKYSFLTNNGAWIGSNESVNGEFHANGGIRFDGTGNAPITSSKTTYSCPDWQGCSGNPTKNGIWGSASAATKSFWQFPVSNVDFSTITADFASLKSKAQNDGAPAFLPASNKSGYSFVFNGDGTLDIYIVKRLLAAPSGNTWDVNGRAVNYSIDYDSSQRQKIYSSVAIPQSGIFYVEDDVWVEGAVKGRVEIVAAKLPYNSNTAPSIYIPNNITYTKTDGSDILGLLSQQDIVATYNAPSDLAISAALVAQSGSIQVYDYSPGNIKNSITLSGSLISYGLWTWSYVNGGGSVVSGFKKTYTNYDSNLLYGPPPGFPLTSDGYQQLYWSSN
jgi:Tfp pilus assembly protein PilX